MTKKSKIKKRKLAAVVGTTLTILIVGIIAVGIWQRNNIKALWIALNEDTETIAEKQEQQKAKRQEILEKYEIVPNEEILASGNGIDIQAIIDEIQQGTEAAKNDEDNGKGGNSKVYSSSVCTGRPILERTGPNCGEYKNGILVIAKGRAD